mmetsp:Transcript_14788/g.19131  ORF Transcript_14788/g.19131 Transcript_14788/m.19131 type:complete len:449 (-) Transcript_14788:506-1852(-)|eukprot:CAMPEP_0204864836 /NCGR_PEP_ID=MMETSP1348-20121228/4364_1 /ASSEMBLY_ACC=CAM_ASM_000700 /TAXON_ID=215587 /ORGANISM="Aplanochytrium stocchinoi, Strain GSBS06" /LENGTH=448 /DNA_ID=CAMNT_0052015619 /DNA_START=179 /DNA_END=1525 /DNA_ORIENTATION=+
MAVQLTNTTSGGWLSIVTICGSIIVLVLCIGFYFFRHNFIIRKREPTSSVVFGLTGIVTASYLTFLIESPEDQITCPMRLAEMITNSSTLFGAWLRGTQLLLQWKIYLYVYSNRRREIDDREKLKPDFFVRNIGIIGSHRVQPLVFILLHCLMVIIWAVVAYVIEVPCDDNIDIGFKIIGIVAGSTGFGVLFMTRNFKDDPTFTFLEGGLDCVITAVGFIAWGVVRAVSDERIYSEAIAIIYLLVVHIVGALGMPIWKAWINSKTAKDDSSDLTSSVAAGEEYQHGDLDSDQVTENRKGPVLLIVPQTLDGIFSDSELLTDFLRYCRKEYSLEGPEFLLQVDSFLKQYRDRQDFDRKTYNVSALMMYRFFFSPHAPLALNVSAAVFEQMKEILAKPAMDERADANRFETLVKVRNEIVTLVMQNQFSRYRHYRKRMNRRAEASRLLVL